MGYRRMNINDLKEILRRLRDRQSLKYISDATGFDRKTIRGYRDRIHEAGLLSDSSVGLEEDVSQALFALLPANERNSPVQDSFEKHKDEIIALVTRKQDPLKPKSAYLVIQEKYEIDGSYESFKLFARKQKITFTAKKSFPRLEQEPGQEIQIDYGKCGTMTDLDTGKRRVVYGFIAKLSCSRLPFVEFTYSQNQVSFVESNINMLEFFGGVPEYLTIDNLKAGVIKADIYDPQLNKAYAEFAEYYGTFINPCIPAHPTGKPKVERQVPEVRELFRRIYAVHPTYSLQELNEAAIQWCRNEYGMNPHGTTRIPPWEAFIELEQQELKPLYAPRFEVPVWTAPKVHMDQFINVDRKKFSMPREYRQTVVHCRRTGNLLKIYDKNYLFIREYYIHSYTSHIGDGDFPESQEAMMRGEYPQYLIRKAASYGSGTKQLVESILHPHAFLNARRALGILSTVEKYRELPLLQDVCFRAADRRVTSPKQLTILLEDEKKQQVFDFDVPRSPEGDRMVRTVEEFFF